jgi:hypothetical protein
LFVCYSVFSFLVREIDKLGRLKYWDYVEYVCKKIITLSKDQQRIIDEAQKKKVAEKPASNEMDVVSDFNLESTANNNSASNNTNSGNTSSNTDHPASTTDSSSTAIATTIAANSTSASTHHAPPKTRLAPLIRPPQATQPSTILTQTLAERLVQEKLVPSFLLDLPKWTTAHYFTPTQKVLLRARIDEVMLKDPLLRGSARCPELYKEIRDSVNASEGNIIAFYKNDWEKV